MTPVSMNHYPRSTGKNLSLQGMKLLSCGYTMGELQFKPGFFLLGSHVPIQTAFQAVECSRNDECGCC